MQKGVGGSTNEFESVFNVGVKFMLQIPTSGILVAVENSDCWNLP